MAQTFPPTDSFPVAVAPPADLMLEVRYPDGTAREAFLQHGLTIGRHLANTLVVEHHDVGSSHARVEGQRDGTYLLKCRGRGNYLLLGDGLALKEMNLWPGAVFRVGPAEIRCAARKPYSVVVPAIALGPAGPDTAGAHAAIGAGGFPSCGRCHAASGRVPAAARYCPRCGAAIGTGEDRAAAGADAPQAAAVAPATPAIPVSVAPNETVDPAADPARAKTPSAAMQFGATLRRLLLTPVWPRPDPLRVRVECVRPQPPPPPDPKVHSLILLGYGNALFKLGWRYETGPARNVPEAVRCYHKAAKLGNEPAKARLPETQAATHPRTLWPEAPQAD